MYNISCKLPTGREPWRLSLDARRALAADAVKSGKKLALYLYQQADTSTFRYRCYNPLQATRESEAWQSVYFFMDELDTVEALLPQSSLFILTRLKWVHVIDELVRKAHSAGVRVLYDVDDLICDLHSLPLVTNTLNVRFGDETPYDFWFAHIARLGFTAERADGFLTTNAFLGERLRERFGKPFEIIMNSLNREQLEVSEQCVKKKAALQSRRPYTIGYFSGTPSHINDFRVVYRELMALLEEYPDMRLDVVGFMEFPETMQSLIQAGRVRFTPLVDFLELQRLMAQVDVSIVPLVENTFTNCKSELKFFEAAVVDTVTVATPTYTYRNAIADGETGFLCQQGEWYERIGELYEQPQRAAEMARRAREYCLERYSGDNFRRQVEQAYDAFA